MNVTAVNFHVEHSSSKQKKRKRKRNTYGQSLQDICSAKVSDTHSHTRTLIIVILRQQIRNSHTGRGVGAWSSLMTSNHRRSKTLCDDFMAGSRWTVNLSVKWGMNALRSADTVMQCSLEKHSRCLIITTWKLSKRYCTSGHMHQQLPANWPATKICADSTCNNLSIFFMGTPIRNPWVLPTQAN